MAYGPKYVPKCQSHFTSSPIEDIIEREYQMMSPIIMNCLTANCVSASNERAKLFFVSLKNLLRHLYTTKLPNSLFYHARQVTGLNVARQNVADKMLRTKCRMDKMSQDKMLQDKMPRTYRCGQNVADKWLQKKRRMDKWLQGQNVVWTKCCTDR